MIEGEVEVLEIDALPQERGDRFAARTCFDPRALAASYRWIRISPRRIQAWREVNELPDRELMRDGRWLVDASARARRVAGAQRLPRAEAAWMPWFLRRARPHPVSRTGVAPPRPTPPIR